MKIIMLRNRHSGLKMGVSRAAHTQYAYMEVPPPPGLESLFCFVQWQIMMNSRDFIKICFINGEISSLYHNGVLF